MPLRDYSCTHCGTTTEILEPMNDAPDQFCSFCPYPAKMLPQISSGSFQLKGSGWYDSRGSVKSQKR